MKLREVTFYKRREDRPPEVEKMAEFFSERDWQFWEEWQEPWEDEDTGEQHEGWWGYHLVHEEMIGDQLHMWHLFPVSISPFPEMWEHTLELGLLGWEQYRERVA